MPFVKDLLGYLTEEKYPSGPPPEGDPPQKSYEAPIEQTYSENTSYSNANYQYRDSSKADTFAAADYLYEGQVSDTTNTYQAQGSNPSSNGPGYY